MTQLRLLLVLGLLLGAGPVLADSIEGRVVEVGDGDTVIVVDAKNRRHKIRLVGIDAPEAKQAFGAESKKHLVRLVLNRSVTVVDPTLDQNGHTIAKLMVSDLNCNHPACTRIHDVGLMQLMAGLAWWYRGYPREQSDSDRGYYEFAEFEAKAKRKGLWQVINPEPPWDWRKRTHKSWSS